ncbi:MAG: RsmE family RNA methyltransferase, partial [Planctomycetes bacterium]|nr:RsmE family RNA methyltransferase [Planctomycetota bacterium]
HPVGERLTAANQPNGEEHSAVFLAVGPEGGFTDEEASLALQAGWQAVNLGPRILRVETAAAALAAWLLLGE